MATDRSENEQKHLALIAFSFVTFPLLFSDCIQAHAPRWAFKGLVGNTFGIVLEIASTMVSNVLCDLKANRLKAITSNPKNLIGHLVLTAVISIIGAVIWTAGCERHDTGVFYGLGVFLGSLITRQGIQPLLKAQYRLSSVNL